MPWLGLVVGESVWRMDLFNVLTLQRCCSNLIRCPPPNINCSEFDFENLFEGL